MRVGWEMRYEVGLEVTGSEVPSEAWSLGFGWGWLSGLATAWANLKPLSLSPRHLECLSLNLDAGERW